MVTREEIADFLFDLKSAVRGGLYHLVERQRNLQGLIDLGLAEPRDAVPILLSLTPENYSSGPEPDRDRPGEEVWVFGIDVQGIEAYVKVKLIEDRRTGIGCRALILGFHPAEHPLDYPLRGGGP
ncbi:MAG: hypothetical protein AMK72_15195 [Planctomycetes bacterium SM23_25]|nr:MAG: hypothetical protein AMK72_15195 [Planctomycetes bacterium SM23_25]